MSDLVTSSRDWTEVAGDHRAPGAAAALPDGSGLRVVIVCARFNDLITNQLLDGARRALGSMGVDEVPVAWVPGAYELPLAARVFAARDDVDAVVALGCVIRGDTPHFDYVAGGAAQGLLDASLATGTPVIFGVLTTENLHQALVRADVARMDKGGEAAVAAVEMARLVQRVGSGGPLGDPG